MAEATILDEVMFQIIRRGQGENASLLAVLFKAVGDHVVEIFCHTFALKRQIQTKISSKSPRVPHWTISARTTIKIYRKLKQNSTSFGQTRRKSLRLAAANLDTNYKLSILSNNILNKI